MNGRINMDLISYMVQLYSEHPETGSKLEDGIDGAIWFEFQDGEDYHYAACMFSKKKFGNYKGANVWMWNGLYDKITLTPSIKFPDYRFHCYVTRGLVEILSDSSVVNKAVRKNYNEFFGLQE